MLRDRDREVTREPEPIEGEAADLGVVDAEHAPLGIHERLARNARELLDDRVARGVVTTKEGGADVEEHAGAERLARVDPASGRELLRRHRRSRTSAPRTSSEATSRRAR